MTLSCLQDVRLVWHNAALYNPPGSDVHTLAIKFSGLFESLYLRVEQRYTARFTEAARNKDHCSLCAGFKFEFEPPTLYCNECTTRNATPRIRRGAFYYTNRSNRYHVCVPCFNILKRDKVVVPFEGMNLTFSELLRKKNESQSEEGWVQCNHCNRWQHQICTLYNVKKSEGDEVPHYCPQCILGHMEARGNPNPIAKPVKGARDLQSTQLSDAIEKQVATLLESRRSLLAAVQERDDAEVEFPQITVCVRLVMFSHLSCDAISHRQLIICFLVTAAWYHALIRPYLYLLRCMRGTNCGATLRSSTTAQNALRCGRQYWELMFSFTVFTYRLAHDLCPLLLSLESSK